MTVLHLIDPSTPLDALEMLSALVGRDDGTVHQVLVMGHRAIAGEAERAGIPRSRMHFARTLGWADPIGWQGLRRAIATLQPNHLHAWGMVGAVAGTVQGTFGGGRILTLTTSPSRRELRLLRIVMQQAPWLITASSSSIYRHLAGGGIRPARVVRIRPGIALSRATGTPKLVLRRALGLDPADGPVLLLGGPATRAARHDHGLWAAAILQQIFPQTRVLVRDASIEGGGREQAGDLVRRFSEYLPAEEMTRFVPGTLPWSTLVQAADLLLVTPDAPIPTGSILWAMAAGVPVIGTAIECVAELVEHGETGLLALAGKPRSIAARLETFMSDATLRWPLTDKARAEVFAHFKVASMAAAFASVYEHAARDPHFDKNVTLPLPDLTAQDRFAGIIRTS